VARPRSPVIASRDDQIYALWCTGRYTLAELGEMQHPPITPQRIVQILASLHPEHEDETSRALHRGRLELLIRDIQGVIEDPGVKMAPNGRVASDGDGNPVLDISAKIEAMKTMIVALKSARDLDGLDRPVKRSLTIELNVAEQQAQADIARRRQEIEGQLRIIRGSAEHVEPREIEPPPAAAEG
jgi:hypothetical protein